MTRSARASSCGGIVIPSFLAVPRLMTSSILVGCCTGSSAGLALVYWFYPQANCTDTTCQLSYGYITSSTGGSTWGAATQVLGPIGLHWIPFTVSGYMVGDYSSVSYVTGGTQTVFAAAQSSNCTEGGSITCKMAMVAPKTPLPGAGPQFRAGHDRVATHLGHVRGELKRMS